MADFLKATLLCFGAVLPAAVALAAAYPSDPGVSVSPCTFGKTHAAALCGTLKVPENRDAPDSRKITLAFVVLKAAHPNGNAIYFNSGGPAETLSHAAEVADGIFPTELRPLREHFDILLSDPRGHGKSHPLRCEVSPPAHPEIYFAHIWDSRLVTGCRERLAGTSDLAQYNVLRAVDDLEDLRAKLGYRTLSFDVFSWGTVLALEYLKKYPAHSGAAALDGVAPPGIPPHGPAAFAHGAQVAIDNLIRQCAANAKCRHDFPNFGRQFSSVTRRLDAGPLEVELVDRATKSMRRLRLSKEVFADALRHALYNPYSAAYFPLIFDRASKGDTKPLAALVNFEVLAFNGFTYGGFLSYTCSEDIPFITQQELRATSAGWYGDARVRAQQRACAIWGVPALPASFDSPVRSDAAVLMISGTDDPATPPQLSAAEMRYLGDGHRLLVRNATHASDLPCADNLKIRFLTMGSAKGLNLQKCSVSPERPPFATSLKGSPLE